MKSCDEVTIDYEAARKELLSVAHKPEAWTKEQKLLIAEFYGLVSPETLSKLVGKTYSAITNKCQAMSARANTTKEKRLDMMKKIRSGEIV